MSTRRKEASGTLGQYPWRPEGASDNEVKVGSKILSVGSFLRSTLEDLASAILLEGCHRLAKKRTAARGSIKKGHLRLEPLVKKDKPRESTA